MAVILRNPSDNYGNCNQCGALIVHKDTHRCPPVWRVWLEDDGEGEAKEVFARDSEDAAVGFCEQFDVDFEYSIARAGSARVVVSREGQQTTFDIEAESRPHYSAWEAD